MKKELCDFCGEKLPHSVTVIRKNYLVRCYDCFSKTEDLDRKAMMNVSKKIIEDWK